jgi:hypothetical protein
MGFRSMVEINHDTTPHTDEEKLAWANAMVAYLSSGDAKHLPSGVTWFKMRHHSEDCPLTPPKGWNNRGI